jgi:multiple sugar transport system permease protein
MSKTFETSLEHRAGNLRGKSRVITSKYLKDKAIRLLLYVTAILLLVVFLFPFYWMFLTAARPSNRVFEYPPRFIEFSYQFEHFWKAWTSSDFFRYLTNTLTVALSASIGQVVAASLVAYGFSRFDFPLKRFFFLLMLSGLLIPWDVFMIGQFLEFKALNWLNTLYPLIIPQFFGSSFIIFVAYQYMSTIPKEFDEAATIDGCNAFQVLYKIIVPLSRPILVFIFAYQFIISWNDYLQPLLFISRKENYTLMLGLTTFLGAYTNDWSGIMAVSTLIVLIPFILFLALQKYLIGGVSGEGLKG